MATTPRRRTRLPDDLDASGDLTDLLDIDSIDVDIDPEIMRRANSPMSLEDLDDVPVELAPDYSEIVNYKSSGEDGQSIVLGARVPISWESIINDIREARGTPFPSVFKVKSDFLRWCLWQGIVRAQAFRRQLALDVTTTDGEDVSMPDPMISAHMFSERNMGMLAARAAIIKKVSTDVGEMADAVALVIKAQEPGEAASMLDAYMEGVQEQESDFWRNYFVGVLFDYPSLVENIGYLIRMGHITNEFLIHAAVAFGVIEPLPDVPDDIEGTPAP